MKEKLNFLEGEWISESAAPGETDGMKGRVTCKWIEKSDWMYCYYAADAPEGKWGAMVLYRWNAEKEVFESHGFMGKGDPGMSEGTLTEEGALRFTFDAGGQQGGLDLFETEEGFTETNWLLDENGDRNIVMTSTCTKAK